MTDDEQDYIDQVFDRATKSIQQGIWDVVTLDRLKAWWDCLDLHQAQLLGAYLLDNLCFRSRAQFHAMLDSLFCGLRSNECGLESSGKLINFLQAPPVNSATREIALAPVIARSEPPTKSGPYILRLAQRRYVINHKWLIWPQYIHENNYLKAVIFVDDFCGSGDQFILFANDIELQRFHTEFPDVKIFYFVTTLHETGHKAILEEFEFIHIRYAERLHKMHSVFSPECFARYDILGFQEKIFAQYDRVIKSAGLSPNGYGQLNLAYTFSHATPDNTLPIFWKATSGWTPLVDR